MEHQIPIFSFFLFNTNNHEYPKITQKFIHEKFVFIHGHSCFLQKIIRRAKLHAATPFVQFAIFAVFIFLVGELSELCEFFLA
jgi:hypothetical protein